MTRQLCALIAIIFISIPVVADTLYLRLNQLGYLPEDSKTAIAFSADSLPESLCAQRDWLLGRNPWGTSMFSGIPEGGVFPRDMHLQTTALTGRSVRGGLVDGPVYERIFKTLKGVSISEPDPFAPFQDELAVYHDNRNDYSSNEPTMDGTASAILMWALLR